MWTARLVSSVHNQNTGYVSTGVRTEHGIYGALQKYACDIYSLLFLWIVDWPNNGSGTSSNGKVSEERKFEHSHGPC